MRDEYHPLVGLRRGDDLPLSWKTVGDFLRQVPSRPKLSNVLLLDGGDHPFALASGSGHGRILAGDVERWGLGRWSSRLERRRQREGVREEEGILIPL